MSLHPCFTLPLPSCLVLLVLAEELVSYKYMQLAFGCGSVCLGVGSASVTIRQCRSMQKGSVRVAGLKSAKLQVAKLQANVVRELPERETWIQCSQTC